MTAEDPDRTTDVDALAAGLCALRWEDLPDPVRSRVRALVADVVAVAALGARRADVRAVQDGLIDGSGPATVIGRRVGAPVSAAAAANAAAVTAHQLQDGHRGARGHPASHVVPAALAVAEAQDATGPQLLMAVLVGYEAAVAVSLAMGGTRPGVHDIGSWGSLGGAVAVAHLISGGDASAVGGAVLGAAAATLVTAAPTVFEGYGMQHLFLAEAARIGLDVGRAAAAGTTAHPGSLDHLAAQVAARWTGLAVPPSDAPWPLQVLRGYVKRHPTCAYLHGVNDAVESLIATDDGLVGHVASVTVRTFRQAAELPSTLPPRNALAARFDIPWTVATALTTGRLDETSFGDDALADPAILRLAREVQVVHAPRLDALASQGRPAEVEVRLGDGTTASAEALTPVGDGALPPDLVTTKAERLLSGRFGEVAAGEVLAAIDALDAADSRVSRLGDVLRVAAGVPCTDAA